MKYAASPDALRRLEASLERLKTDYIDLYWLHIWDQPTPVEEVMRAFEDLVRQGKVLYWWEVGGPGPITFCPSRAG